MGDGDIIEVRSGSGLLDARALWASIVGPQRLALGARKVARLVNTTPVEIYKNLGASKAYAFVGVALPFNTVANPLNVVFGRDDSQLGFNSGLPVQLTPNQINFNFTQLLLPGEQLFAQILGAVADQNVVVSVALF